LPNASRSFWANHFTVSMAKASARGLVGAFEREAIRPNIAGRFEDLLVAAVKHAGMLRYLDNDQSAGPESRLVRRSRARRVGPRDGRPAHHRPEREPGARGAGIAHAGRQRGWLDLWRRGGYTQADVTAFARVLTGWRVPLRELLAPKNCPRSHPVSRFEEAWHEPGPKTPARQGLPRGAQALDQVLHDLSRHPSTARFIACKLARHFVADEPPTGWSSGWRGTS
jgi:uncharacterized protein (DUF1800 family)